MKYTVITTQKFSLMHRLFVGLRRPMWTFD